MNKKEAMSPKLRPGAATLLLTVFLQITGLPCRADGIRAVPVGVVPYAMCAMDLDGDGKLELLVGGLDRNVICAIATGGTRLWLRKTEGMPLAIKTGDLDGDGEEEIAAVIGTSASKIVIINRDGKLLKEIFPDTIVYLLQIADINNDKKADIIVAGYMGKILAYNVRGRKIFDKLVTKRNFYRQMAGLAVGDVDGDGRPDIAYHGALQKPGVMNAKGKPIAQWILPPKGRLAECADVNNDGQAELIFADLRHIRADSRNRKLWSTNLSQKGSELAAEANGATKYPWEYGGTRSLAVGDFTKGEGLEIVSFASDGKFNLLSASGQSLLRAKTKYPLLNIAAADMDGDGFDDALLVRLHYKNVYVLRFNDGIETAKRSLLETMATDVVTEGIDDILTRIDASKKRSVAVKSSDEKLHVLWGMEGTIAPQLLRSAIRVIDKKMRELRCDNVEYAFMFTLKERGVRRFKRNGICAVGPLASSGEKLLDLCREWEEMGVRFYPVVSHMGVPTVMPETAKKIMDVAPNACQGYLTWETMCNYPSEVWYDFLKRMNALAEICVKRGKKILFAEEAPFWIALISDPKARSLLLKPEYKSVLVPVLKTLQPQGDEAELSAYIGSMLAGEIQAWGITSEEDFWPMMLGYYRGCPDDIIMRQEIMAVALGARYLMIESGHIYFEPTDAKGKYNLFQAVDARISREARRERMAIELFRKGIVGHVSARDLLSVSPVGFGISRSPKAAKSGMRWESFGVRLFDGAGLLNMDLTRPLSNSGQYSISRNVYGAKKLMNGVFPVTRWGIVPILGQQAAARGVEGVSKVFETDGEFVTVERGRLPARAATPKIVGALEAAARSLPFRADGVFISAARVGDDAYQVFLMDTEMFAPTAVQATLTTSLQGLVCFDEITGDRLAMTENQVRLTVPAGGWRLLRFEAGG